uniref:Uncharacterized protein n=1 Tax=Myotis myotis TaxID=51298 RepID=A0A7J7XHL3_MYOMY|nr:hypothetical protein mMyoMyo1_011741 [Myotis myotis]
MIFVFTFCLFVFITFKASPPTPQKCIFTIFFRSPTFYKDSQIQSMECLCSVPPGAPPPTPHSPGLVPQSPRHLMSGPGWGWGVPGTGPLAVGLQAALAVGWGSPQPHLLVLPPSHLHVNLYI